MVKVEAVNRQCKLKLVQIFFFKEGNNVTKNIAPSELRIVKVICHRNYIYSTNRDFLTSFFNLFYI